jgi:hypothetical protein
MRRREFLKIGATAIPAVLPVTISAAVSFRASAAIRKYRLEALVPYLDTLLPEDGAPSASQLSLHEHLVDHALDVPNYVELLSLGCRWLDGQAGPGANFAALGEAARVRLINLMEHSTPGTIERQFFERTLADAMQFYYAHPRTWKVLGFAGPPQPVGFPDYRQPPA